MKLKPLVIAGLFSVVSATAIAQGAADNTNSRSAPGTPTFQNWMNDQSRTNQGYISREAYMQEAGRRWDQMDTSRRGLTADQINSLYGPSPTPGQVNPPTNQTNPTGTEPKGQNSGG